MAAAGQNTNGVISARLVAGAVMSYKRIRDVIVAGVVTV